MRRLPTLAALCALSMVQVGCGFASYEARIEATQRRLKDEMTLNAALYDKLEGAFSQNGIYLRFPQGLAQAPQFQPIPLNPGYFEVEASFIPPGSQGQLSGGPFQLHVLARRDTPDQPEEPEPDRPPVPRGDFRSDVLGVLAEVYGPEVTSAPVEQVGKTIWPRSEPPRSIPFDRVVFTDRNQQLVHIYFYNEQSGDATYDVALIWEFSGGEPSGSDSQKVDLTLGTFAVGQRAAARFSGRPEGPGDAGGSAVTF